jgi:hypothetical protein
MTSSRFSNPLAFYFVKGILMLVLVACLISAALQLGNLVFGRIPNISFGNGWNFGISNSPAIPVKADLNETIPDSSLYETYRYSNGTTGAGIHYIYRDKFPMLPIHFSTPQENGGTFVYGDTIVTHFFTIGDTPPVEIRSAAITQLELYIQPTRLPDKIIYLLPGLLGALLVAWCAWHLLRTLDSITKGNSFGSRNYRRLLKIGYGIVIVETLYILLSFTSYTRQVHVAFSSGIPHYREPFSLSGHPASPFQAGWLVAGFIIIIVSNAFKEGTLLQEENALTV